MICPQMSAPERAQLAMVLEVAAFPKPGNVDRCHDYARTTLEHFLASAIFARPALEKAAGKTKGAGKYLKEAVALTACHGGGNTHFGAFILLIPLVMGGDIGGAQKVIAQTTVEDAVAFYDAFALTKVRILEGDEFDVQDPTATKKLREQKMTMTDVMAHSAKNDMVAREWVNGFHLTRRAADLIPQYGTGRRAIADAFLALLAEEPDTFICKEHGPAVADEVREKAQQVRAGTMRVEDLDEECIRRGINPGSLADITIAGIYTALGEGWSWEC
jgi:triphosphoribosyl-dephospho-CoA synthase